jgi:hypothetical protein
MTKPMLAKPQDKKIGIWDLKIGILKKNILHCIIPKRRLGFEYSITISKGDSDLLGVKF